MMDEKLKYYLVLSVSIIFSVSLHTAEIAESKAEKEAVSKEKVFLKPSQQSTTVKSDACKGKKKQVCLSSAYSLTVYKEVDLGKAKSDSNTIEDLESLEKLCKKSGKKIPEIDFEKFIIVVDRQDTADNSDIEVIYTNGNYITLNKTTLGSFPSNKTFRTKFYVVERQK